MVQQLLFADGRGSLMVVGAVSGCGSKFLGCGSWLWVGLWVADGRGRGSQFLVVGRRWSWLWVVVPGCVPRSCGWI